MATYDYTADTRRNLGNPVVVKKTFDAAKYNLAQNDVAQLIDVPANSYVQLVRYAVETVEGAARNFQIGDGADANGYIVSTSGNAIAEGVSGPVSLTEGAPNTVTGYSNGKYYADADTIDLTAVSAGGLTGLKVTVTALIVELG